jgi:tetratricopeptide (TPR) repeat protein
LEEHLNEDQIDELLRLASRGKEESVDAGRGQEDILAHLKTCELCRSRVQSQERVMDQLALLKPQAPTAPTTNCPPEDVWIEIASGVSPQDSGSYLSHAASCDHCGPLLRQSFSDLAEELNPEEEALLLSLNSSNMKWQKDRAVTLRDAAPPQAEKPTPGDRRSSWLDAFLFPRSLAYAAGLLVLLTFGTWFAVHTERESALRREERNSAGQLLAAAYAEKRLLEVRIDGAPYVPLRQERGENGDQSRMSRPALLKAEAEAAQHLQSNPDDAEWLQASGRASLLEDNTQSSETAVTVLEKAHRLAPNNQSISIDLASAYLLRGQLADRPEDYGVAAETLAKVLSVRPEDEVAQYNHAIALEKLLLKAQAKEAWQAFLKSHPASLWAPEAQERLARLNQEISRRNERTGQPLKSPERLAAIFTGKHDTDIADIDNHIEEYQDRSVDIWLPAYFAQDTSSTSEPRALSIALSGLAALLKDRHGDHWLADMLIADRHSAQLRRAVQLLSHSDQMAQSSDDGPIEQEAAEASHLFHQADSPAGELRSQFVLALVEQLQHRRRPCEQTSQMLLKGLANKKYAWIETQTALEAGICADTSDKQALQDLETGSAMAATHHYRILALRATMFESGLFWVLGDQHHAWSLASNGLHDFWAGNYPNLRGYNMLVCLDDLVTTHDQPLLEVSILKEAVPMIDDEPRPAMAAFEHAHLGQIQIESGDIDGAEKSFRRSRELFNTLSPGRRRDALSAEAELGLAKVEYQRGNTLAAEDRLRRVRSTITQLPDDRLVMDYYQTSGQVNLRAGKLDDAESDLNSAIELSEARLRLVSSDDDRWQWSHRNEASYRALVELQLQKDPALALSYWEWYKGAPLRARQASLTQFTPPDERSHSHKPNTPPNTLADSQQVPPGTALISYFTASNGAIVWVSDSTGIREFLLRTEATDLSNRIKKKGLYTLVSYP